MSKKCSKDHFVLLIISLPYSGSWKTHNFLLFRLVVLACTTLAYEKDSRKRIRQISECPKGIKWKEQCAMRNLLPEKLITEEKQKEKIMETAFIVHFVCIYLSCKQHQLRVNCGYRTGNDEIKKYMLMTIASLPWGLWEYSFFSRFFSYLLPSTVAEFLGATCAVWKMLIWKIWPRSKEKKNIEYFRLEIYLSGLHYSAWNITSKKILIPSFCANIYLIP